ncbi:MAG: AAA family ATPase, partial [Roseburia sp.]|nr:AAA family ATPase [Roseburia sp.]
REVLESALGGVLFIDEAYSLSQGTGNDFGIEAVDEILKFMEDHRKDIVIILAGYTKEMGEFMQTNSGLVSRVPHTFDFEDYTPDEIVQIGLLGLHNAGYQVDEAYYGEVVKNNYSKTDDHSNGRWVRNFNEKLIMAMSDRVSKAEDADLNLILNEDLDKVAVRMSGTFQAEKKPAAEHKVDENGYVLPN